MRWSHVMRATPGLLLALAGCSSIAGSWRTTAIEPPGASFPVAAVSFDRDNNYTATRIHQGEKRTSTGRYEFNGFTHSVVEGSNVPRT